MKPEEALELIRKLLQKEKVLPDSSSLADEESLLDTGRLKSISVIRVVTELERAFGIRLAPGDITADNLQSVKAMAELVARKKL